MVNCPVCNSELTHFALKVKDHSVSGEYFDIFECKRCSLRFTKDPPPEDKISRYYQSETYISHSNTKKGLVNSLYHIVRNKTLNSKYRLIESATAVQSGHHLDIGAGTGAFVQYMNKHNWKSVGIEPDRKARERALKDHETELLPGESFETLLSASFDAISLWHVLEHVHDLHSYMHRIKELLKPAGYVFIAVPNYTSPDAKKYKANWAAYDVPRHLYHFSPPSMRWLLNAAGFQLKKIEPMWWDSFYISLLSEKYAGSNVSILKGFFSGAISNIKTLSNTENCSSLIYIASKQ